MQLTLIDDEGPVVIGSSSALLGHATVEIRANRLAPFKRFQCNPELVKCSVSPPFLTIVLPFPWQGELFHLIP